MFFAKGVLVLETEGFSEDLDAEFLAKGVLALLTKGFSENLDAKSSSLKVCLFYELKVSRRINLSGKCS